MITDLQYRQAVHIVDESGAADLLKTLVYPNAQGRRGPLTPRAFLIGYVLAVMTEGLAYYDRIHRLLTRQLSPAAQVALGVVTREDQPDGMTVLTERVTLQHFYNFTRKLREAMAPNEPLNAERHALLLGLSHALIATTLPDRPDGSSDYAIDESCHWAHSLGRKGGESAGDLEAKWAGRTAKDGSSASFFGYSLHGLVRLPAVGTDGSSEPILLEAFDLTPAGEDMVDTSLAIIDRVRAHHGDDAVGELLGDRHYSYKKAERWQDQLRLRGIDQVMDFRATDNAFHDVDGAKVINGWPHCPCTPDTFAKRDRPRPGEGPTPDDHRSFNAFIEARKAWALQRRTTHRQDKIRYQCPARNGTLGCELVEGTVAVAREVGLPIVENAPDIATAPNVCRQQTVTLHIDDIGRKDIQKEYYGDRDWRANFGRRTYVEGWFGNAKDPAKENVSRSGSRGDCRGLRLLYVGIAAAVVNLRLLRSWHTQHGQETTPPGVDPVLLEQEPDTSIRIVPTELLEAA